MPEDVLTVLGTRLRKARKEHGFTQDQLSLASGVSVRHIAKIEKGVMNPSFEIMLLLVKALSISLDSLVKSTSEEDDDVREMIDLYRACPYHDRPLVKSTLRAMVHTLTENQKQPV